MDLNSGVNLNSIVNYVIILSGLGGLILLVSISLSRFVKHEKILEGRLPKDLPKIDPWGYPVDDEEGKLPETRLREIP